MEAREKEVLFEVIQLLRTQVTPNFYDWVDADDWIFSQLSLTKSEIKEIFADKGIRVYYGSAIDD